MEDIGKLIKKRLKERGLSNAEFARRINTHIRNVYDIFKRKSLDTELLTKIGDVLEYNFFQYYSMSDDKIFKVEESDTVYKTIQHELIELRNKVKYLEDTNILLLNEIKYLKEINELLKEKQNLQK